MASLAERREPVAVPTPASASRRSPWVVAGLGAVVALATGLRIWGLTRDGPWYDEAITGWLLRLPPGEMLRTIPHTESTPPLYYLLAWGWVRVLGDGLAVLRALSLVAGVGAVVATFAAGRTVAGARAGLAAAVLVAVDPMLVWYSQEARAYSLLVLLSAVSLWLAARARARPSPARLAAWALVAAAALWTHYFAVFLVAPQAVWLLARRGRPRIATLAAITATVVAALPLLPMAYAQRHHATVFARVSLHVRVGQVGRELFAGFTPPASRGLPLAMSAAVAVFVIAGVVLSRGAARRAALAVAAIGVAGIALPLALALLGRDVLDARNVIGSVIPLAVAAGIGMTVRPARFAGVAVLTVMAVVSVGLLAALARDIPAQRPHWAQVAAALRGGLQPRVILLDGGGSWHMPIAYEVPHAWWLPNRGARVRQLDVVRRVSRQECLGSTFWGASCDLPPHPLPHQLPGHGWQRVGERRIAGYAVTVYRSRTPVFVRPSRLARHHRHHRRLMLVPARVPAVP